MEQNKCERDRNKTNTEVSSSGRSSSLLFGKTQRALDQQVAGACCRRLHGVQVISVCCSDEQSAPAGEPVPWRMLAT